MGAWNAISDIIGATTTPSPNPYYGAQLLTPTDHPSIQQPTWVDATGKPITDQTHVAALTANPQLTTQPYNAPGFWAKLGSVGQAEQRANMEAGQQAGAAQRINEIRNTIGGQNFARVQPFAPSQLQHVDPTTGYLLAEGQTSPQALNQAGQYITQNQLGQPNTTAQANNTEEQNRLIGQTASQTLGVPWKTMLAQEGNLTFDNNMSRARNAALMNGGAQAMGNQAQIDAATTGQGVQDIPITTGTQHLGTIAQNYLAGRMPDETVSTPYMSTIGINGVQNSGGVLNPNFRPPAAAMMAAIRNGTYTGGASGQTHTLPSGQTIVVPQTPGSNIVSPTLGTSYQQPNAANVAPNNQPPNVPPAGKLVPVAGTHYEHDENGALYYDGQWVPEENYKGTPIEAALKHQMNLEKKVKDTVNTHPLPSSRLHTIGQGIKNTAYDIGTGGQYMRDLGSSAANLIGKASNWLTQPPTN